MNGRIDQSALTRLLVLNKQACDLDHQLEQQRISTAPGYERWVLLDLEPTPVAALQDEIDRITRASLMTCWLSSEAPPDI